MMEIPGGNRTAIANNGRWRVPWGRPSSNRAVNVAVKFRLGLLDTTV